MAMASFTAALHEGPVAEIVTINPRVVSREHPPSSGFGVEVGFGVLVGAGVTVGAGVSVGAGVGIGVTTGAGVGAGAGVVDATTELM